MSAAAQSGGRVRAPAGMPPPNWQAIGVALAILVQFGSAVWFAAGVDRRVAALEAAVPPGSIAMLVERTEQMQRVLGHLEARP